jgi:peptide/nickel transport system permease protein
MPSFWLALMLVLVFSLKAYQWGWPIAFPPTGMTSVDYEFLGVGGRVVDRLMHLCTARRHADARARRRRRPLRTRPDARSDAPGLHPHRAGQGAARAHVILKHALRNSLIPVITLLGLYLPFLFSGAVFVEYIFAWPGMGRVIVDAILQRDYPLIMATSLLFATMVVLGNLLADVLYAVADPRIRYD